MDNRQIRIVLVLVLLAVLAWLIVLFPRFMDESYSIEESEADCELSLHVYLNAQHLYFRKDWDNDGKSEFATDLDRLHTPDLAEKAAWERPLINKPLAEADDDNDIASGSNLLSRVPRKGYLYHDLRGVMEKGVQRDFTIDTESTAGYTDGFGLLGYPAEYGKTGRRKFVIGPDGTVYAKDEGNNHPFDYFPDVQDGGWTPVK